MGKNKGNVRERRNVREKERIKRTCENELGRRTRLRWVTRSEREDGQKL